MITIGANACISQGATILTGNHNYKRAWNPTQRALSAVAWTAPTFNDDGSLKTPAYVTAFLNGILVQNHFALIGQTLYIGKPFYKKYDTAPIKLQAHGDKSEPMSYRNTWVRELP